MWCRPHCAPFHFATQDAMARARALLPTTPNTRPIGECGSMAGTVGYATINEVRGCSPNRTLQFTSQYPKPSRGC